MSFQIQRGEWLHQAIKRMAHSELDDARAALETAVHKSHRARRKRVGIPSESLHDARVALKRTRALARLAEPAVGRAAHQADRALRAVARKLGPIRDGQVLLLTFDRLRTHARAGSARVPDSRKLTQARQALAALRRQGADTLSLDAARTLVAKLDRARGQVARWAPEQEPEQDRWRWGSDCSPRSRRPGPISCVLIFAPFVARRRAPPPRDAFGRGLAGAGDT
jgi:CHAD domain-containing protein